MVVGADRQCVQNPVLMASERICYMWVLAGRRGGRAYLHLEVLPLGLSVLGVVCFLGYCL